MQSLIPERSSAAGNEEAGPTWRSDRLLVAPEEGDRESPAASGGGDDDAVLVRLPVHHQLAEVHPRGDAAAVYVAAVPVGHLPPRLRVAGVVDRAVPAARVPPARAASGE